MRLTQEGFTDEQFRWCFWGPTGSGGPESDAANAGGFGGGDGSDRDAGRSGPSAGDPSQNAGNIGVGSGAGLGASSDGQDRGGPSFGGGDSQRGGGAPPSVSPSRTPDIGSTAGVMAALGRSSPSPVSVSQAPAPSIAPNLVNQPLSVGGAFSMPYDSYQRSPQQMFGYGGLTASPYSPSAISFAGGQATRSYDPLGGESLSVFDMGRSPQDYADRSFFDRAAEAVGGRFGAPFQEQRAGFFDPATGSFRDVGGTSTLEKTSENPLGDLFANYVGGMFGSTVDTATYAPLIGGEEYQYSDVGGLLGLLSDGPQMVPMSEIEARAAEMGGGDGGDGGSRQPLIIPTEEEDEQTAGPTEFPPFRQREYEYTPFTSNFYTIPQRFRRF